MALEAKNKIGFVNGSIPEATLGDALRITWERNTKTVLSWIIRTLSSEIARSVMMCNSAFDMWQELKQRFSQGNNTKVANLQEELHSLKQGSMSVTGFFTQMKSLWCQLEDFRPIFMCACSRSCTCRIYRDQDCAMRFLKGLNDQFSIAKISDSHDGPPSKHE